MFQEFSITANDLALNVARGPANGPPLILLHGVTRNWHDFAPLLADLTTRWQIFALDFRGHGKSQRASEYRTVDYVRDATALIADTVSGRAVIYGHSLGAMVAAAVAAENPDRVRAVVLEDPPWETLGGRIFETAFHSFFSGMRQLLSDTPVNIVHVLG